MKRQAVQNSGDCQVCLGTGWELFEEYLEGYGKHEVARPCTHCNASFQIGSRAGIPKQYELSNLDCFDFAAYGTDMSRFEKLINNFLEKYALWEKNGKGLFLWSRTPGSGKTFLSCCLSQSIAITYGIDICFVTAPEYISLVGESYKREAGCIDVSEKYRVCRLLILDDIGAQKTGDWQEQELFRLINMRLEEGLVTIFTSNLSPENLNLNARVIDRIQASTVVLQFPEVSIRQKKAKTDQNAFINFALHGGVIS